MPEYSFWWFPMIVQSFAEQLNRQQEMWNIYHTSTTTYWYCNISGQFVNFNKSKVQFSKEIHKVDKKQIKEILQINSSKSIGTYLHCSNNVQRRTRTYVEETKHSLGRKETWWKTCILSNAGKFVLIKSNLKSASHVGRISMCHVESKFPIWRPTNTPT